MNVEPTPAATCSVQPQVDFRGGVWVVESENSFWQPPSVGSICGTFERAVVVAVAGYSSRCCDPANRQHTVSRTNDTQFVVEVIEEGEVQATVGIRWYPVA